MILWFSGTGNSRYVAEQLSAATGDALRELTPSLGASPLKLAPGDGRIIWVCPVYSWGLPPFVRKMLKGISIKAVEPAVVHHLVVTCGDDCGLTAEMWRKDIKSRNWTAGCTFSVIMPNNYVCMKGFDVDPAKLEKSKLSAAPARIAEIAVKLTDFTPGKQAIDDLTRGRFAWIKTKVIYPWFVRHAMSPKPFHYTKACISCGKCAAICPLRNITMVTGNPDQKSGRQRKHPHWGADCAGCLGCYHVCPRHAVMYGTATKNKGQYLNPIIKAPQ